MIASLLSKVLHDNSHEAEIQDQEVTEIQAELERCRMDRDEWEHALISEKVVSDEDRAATASSRPEFEL
ncbi:hypothetical protein K439DRAFT_1634434 [Ramaria rubella]|nr:hypothetical protein K439DRAFT_1634434 [Ramaria rubella]